MGFLDFLKKDKKVPKSPESPDNIPPPPSQPRSDPISFDDVPAPPPEMADPNFLEDTSYKPEDHLFDEPAPKLPKEPSAPENVPAPKIPPAPQEMPSEKKPVPAPSIAKDPEEKANTFDIPDFTDEELEQFKPKKDLPKLDEKKIPEPKYLPKKWTMEDADKERKSIEKESEDFRPHHDERIEPAHEMKAFGSMEPAEFISSETYFSLQEEFKGMRKVLRSSDKDIRTAMHKHEQADLKIEKLAIEINDIQERLINLDGSLFS